MDEYVTKKEFLELEEKISKIQLFDEEHMKLHQQMMTQMKPISDVFNNVNGFEKVSILLLKGLLLLGSAIGVVYTLLKYIKS